MIEQNINPCEPPKEKFTLWGIKYYINNDVYSGVAVVLARDAQHAIQVFKTNSAFNGNQQDIIVEATAQIPDLTESGLCIECYVDTDGLTHINYGN